jgi:hypothetical protein
MNHACQEASYPETLVTSDEALIRAGRIEGFQLIERPKWQPVAKAGKHKQVPAGDFPEKPPGT